MKRKNSVIERSDKEIITAINEFLDKVWYNRHQNLKYRVLYEGEHIDPIIWKTAKAAAKKKEEKYGKKNLIYNDFEWGMVNGKLSALRWITGYDWDMLDS